MSAAVRARNGVAIRSSGTRGQTLQTTRCERCDAVVRRYVMSRFTFCRGCWRAFPDVRSRIIRERLAAAWPDGEPIERDFPSYADYILARAAHQLDEARLRHDDRSIPDAEILGRLGPVAVRG